ncbi:S26 family signal peptidase [Streptomyces sp. NPDC090445]|uniref:S26 family signal peptidase n=1 Tax=Streptomyces sp. NPDC090445 TaxID=3365963 RepID=UPI00381CE214
MTVLRTTPVCAAAALAAAAVVAVGLRRLRRRLVVVTVQGLSMQPTYQPGDRVLVRRGHVPGRGGIIVVERPAADEPHWAGPAAGLGCPTGGVDARAWLIKRVAAVPGDPTPAPQAATAACTAPQVPADALYLLGDHARVSFDSRQFGFFPCDRVLGSVLRKL